jgi:hypothetical protein
MRRQISLSIINKFARPAEKQISKNLSSAVSLGGQSSVFNSNPRRGSMVNFRGAKFSVNFARFSAKIIHDKGTQYEKYVKFFVCDGHHGLYHRL